MLRLFHAEIGNLNDMDLLNEPVSLPVAAGIVLATIAALYFLLKPAGKSSSDAEFVPPALPG